MALNLIGILYYADDPHKRVFRVVYPEVDDSELDQPPTDANRRAMLKDDGSPHTWASFGIPDPSRAVVFEKVLRGVEKARKRGSIHTKASDPVV